MNRDQKFNLIRSLDEDVRYDGRKKDEYRDITITPGVSETAEGSVKVQIGETVVIAGVKLEVGTPYPDSPDEGVLMVGVELCPISSEEYEPGPPQFNAIELARVTDRAIRESRCMDTHKLCITKGEKVWMVNVDISVMNDDGSLFDACSLAAMAAITNTKLPTVDKEGNLDYHKMTKEGLPLEKVPLSVTVYKIGNHLVVDPTRLEENAADARLTIGTIDKKLLCSMQKGGEGTLKKDDVIEMAEIAVAKADELRKLLK